MTPSGRERAAGDEATRAAHRPSARSRTWVLERHGHSTTPASSISRCTPRPRHPWWALAREHRAVRPDDSLSNSRGRHRSLRASPCRGVEEALRNGGGLPTKPSRRARHVDDGGGQGRCRVTGFDEEGLPAPGGRRRAWAPWRQARDRHLLGWIAARAATCGRPSDGAHARSWPTYPAARMTGDRAGAISGMSGRGTRSRARHGRMARPATRCLYTLTRLSPL